MITKSQRKKLKKHLKNDYAEDVLLKLQSKKILTRYKAPYSESSVRMVFNGFRENKDIETAILEVYEDREQDLNKHEAYKKEVLSA